MRFREFKLSESILREAEARIQHAEDLVFWEGSRGAVRALEGLKKMEQGGHRDVTIKWDGSPAIIFGRDGEGNFVLTDKSGFTAKGYNGKAKSGKELETMLMNRPGAKNPEKAEGYRALAANMRDIFDEYEKSVPKDFEGFYKGDLLYFNTPQVEGDDYVFTPNIVTYSVKTDSDIGKRIAQSKTGVVIHRYIDPQGQERPVTAKEVNDTLQGTEALAFPPVSVQRPPEVNDSSVKDLQAQISKNAASMDALLDKSKLAELKLTDLPNVFYSYLNSKVDTGMSGLGDDFAGWLQNSKVSKPKQQRIMELINQNRSGFQSIWQVVQGIQKVKNNIINQLDSQQTDVRASIGSDQGGEGYVLAHPQGDIKLVDREGFTRANRSVKRD